MCNKNHPSAKDILETYYGLPLDQIPTQPPEEDEELDWRPDVGSEIITD